MTPSENDVPLGMKALTTCIATERRNLFAQPRSTATKNVLGPLLGTRTFGMVFGHGKDKVLKVSRFGRLRMIETEASVLSYLTKKARKEGARGI